MSKVAEKVADSLYRKDYISEEEKEIYSYGYEILIDNIGKTFLLLMVGAIIHQFVATLVFVVVFTTLRSYCGGYHASKTVSYTHLNLWNGSGNGRLSVSNDVNPL